MIIFSPFSPFQLVSFFNPTTHTISESRYIILKCKSIKNEFMQLFVIKKHANTFYSTFYLNVTGQSQQKIKMQNISIFFPAIYISLRFLLPIPKLLNLFQILFSPQILTCSIIQFKIQNLNCQIGFKVFTCHKSEMQVV